MNKNFVKMKGQFLFKNAHIYDPFNKTNISQFSILVENNKIKKMAKKISVNDNTKIIDCTDKIICPGFVDLHAHFREPGREDKETLKSGAFSAMAGGFTRVAVMPNTNPPIDSPEQIKFIVEKASKLPVKIYPIGTITMKQKGEELAELGEMFKNGAVAFSDDGIPIENGNILRNAMEYCKIFNVPVINHAEDVCLRNDGLMNEGIISTQLGLPGNPDISEASMIFRDLSIAEYVDGLIHIPHVSTQKSVKIIKDFKSRGVKVTAEVTPHHIFLNDTELVNYNTNAKVAPPLRSSEDQKILQEALLDGTIDCIATDHAPHTIEDKEKDFHHSPCGAISLESAFPAVNSALKINSIELIDKFTINPAKIFKLEIEGLKEDADAEFVVIDPKKEWVFKSNNIFSKSKNSPILNKKLIGYIYKTISQGVIFNNH